MADIDAMYYQVGVQEHHHDVLRFHKEISTGHWKSTSMKVHLFGEVSSPSIANFALKQIVVNNSDEYSADAVDAIN